MLLVCVVWWNMVEMSVTYKEFSCLTCCRGSMWRGWVVCLAVSVEVSQLLCVLRYFSLTLAVFPPSPTRVKSRGNLLSFLGGIVTLPCRVTTRSSVPGSTVQATSLGYPSPPHRRLWCQRDSTAKLVTELQAPPLNRSHLIVIRHLPPQFSPCV